MDLSSDRSQDEDRISQRQLYRAGQNQQTAKASASAGGAPVRSVAKKTSAPSGDQSSTGQRILLMFLLLGVGYFLLQGTPSQRRKTLIGLGVAAWLLLLGGVSYCLFLPNLEALNREQMAIWQNKDLTPEEKREKSEELREKVKNLTPTQRKQMWEMSRKEMTRKGNKRTFDFLQLSPDEQVAQLKKEAAEREKFMQEMLKMRANRGGGNGGNRGGGGPGGGKGGGGGGPGGGGGGPAGGWGGGGGGRDDSSPNALGKQLDSRSPEARAGQAYKMGMMQKLGLGFGGRGGGGPGGGPGGRR